jgi:hypothetical protein
MYKPESVETVVVKFEKTITDGRVLVNGKQYVDLDPDERAFFALSVNSQKSKLEEQEKQRGNFFRFPKKTRLIYSH